MYYNPGPMSNWSALVEFDCCTSDAGQARMWLSFVAHHCQTPVCQV